MIIISLLVGAGTLLISIAMMRFLPQWDDKPYLSFWKLPTAISLVMGVGISLIGRGNIW